MDEWFSFTKDMEYEMLEQQSIELVDCLVSNIKQLEAKVVCLRHELSRYIPDKYKGEMLRCDILSDLSSCDFYDNPVFQRFVSCHHKGENPFDDIDLCALVKHLERNGLPECARL